MGQFSCKRGIDGKEREIEIVYGRLFPSPEQSDPHHTLYQGEFETPELMDQGEEVWINSPDKGINWEKATIRFRNKFGAKTYLYFCDFTILKNNL